jgi:hypothetical protein
MHDRQRRLVSAAIEHMPLVFKAGIGYRADAIIESLKGQVGLY